MSDAKKRKFDKKKKFCAKADYSKKQYMECGQRGFLATCNFREKDTVRECYHILNDYADTLYPDISDSALKPSTGEAEESSKDSDDEVDISKQLEEEITKTAVEQKKKVYRFQVVDTGCQNCVFIKTSLPDPVEIVHKIMIDAAETKVRKTRNVLRLIPIEVVCKANLPDIINASGQLFDKYFLKESKTFSIVFNKRYNSAISREEVIKQLAELIDSKNMKNKVDLKNAELSVIVEVIKGLCCLSVLPRYLQLKKYNITELTMTNSEKTVATSSAEEASVSAKTKNTCVGDDVEKAETEEEFKADSVKAEEK